MSTWVKEDVPFLALPPSDIPLGGWRDPYIIGRPGQGGNTRWRMIIGSGLKNKGGIVMVYESDHLSHGGSGHNPYLTDARQ